MFTRRFKYYLIAKGYLTCIEQATDKLIGIILKNNPHILINYMQAR